MLCRSAPEANMTVAPRRAASSPQAHVTTATAKSTGTVRLVGLSLILSYLIGLAIGVVQAARSRSRIDTLLSVSSVTLFAVPGYWLGLMLVLVFTYWTQALPAFGAAGLDSDYLHGGSWLIDRLRHLALPLATLTLLGIGGAARFARGPMPETSRRPII